MRTYHPDNDDYMTNGHIDCGCEQCQSDEFTIEGEGLFYDDHYEDEDDVYDDPYEVVMYDIDPGTADDLHALIYMLNDTARAWYAKRRLNILASSGPLYALVADIIMDSRGRPWNPLLHPRDRFGRFIETGGFFRWFLKGVWNRGQVVRIDSDGTIYARSKGNDRIPDGTILKFNHKDAAKFISTASDKADLTPDTIDLDVDIPDFPEASTTQKRIYNALQFGDMPPGDLNIYRADGDNLSGTDIGNEIDDLNKRGLIEIYEGPEGARVRRGGEEIATLDVDEIDDVPDDETPDIEDSPNLTRAQRDLVDRMVELDRGEGDGVLRDEIADASDEDLQALVEAGMLEHDGDLVDSPYHLNNPEGLDDSTIDTPEVDTDTEVDIDVVDEIDKAAGDRFPNDQDQQDAFITRANELAGFEEPDEAREYDRKEKRARDAADKWWDEFNSGDSEVSVEDVPAEEDVVEEAAPVEKKRAEYRADALEALDIFGVPAEDLDTPKGEKYLQGVTDLLYAADLEEQGQTRRAELNREGGYRKLRDSGVDEEDIKKWPAFIESFRNDQKNLDVPEADVPEDVPEADAAPDVAPEADVTPDGVQEATRDDVIQILDLQYPDGDQPYGYYLDEKVDHIVNAYNGPFRDDVEAGRTDDMSLEEFAKDFDILDEADWRNDKPDMFVEYKPFEPRQDTPEADAPEADAPESVGTDIGPDTAEALDNIDFNALGQWADWAKRVRDRRDDGADLDAELEDERFIAEEMGLDLDSPAIDTWTSLTNEIGEDEAQALYEEFDGDITQARLNHIIRQNDSGPEVDNAENELDRRDAEADINVDLNNIQSIPAPASDTEDDADWNAALDEARSQDVVSASDHPVISLLDNQKPFKIEDFADVTEDGQGLLDQEGKAVRIGNWYRARRGGERDPGQLVGFYDQDRFPGWMLVRAPDGKYKAVHVYGRGGQGAKGGMRRIDPADLGAELDDWRAQRVAKAGGEADVLGQFDPRNKMGDGVRAEVGMRVENKARGKADKLGDQVGIVARVVADDRGVKVYILVPGAENERQLIEKKVSQIQRAADTPAPPTPPTNIPEAPNAPDVPELELPVGAWPRQADDELLDRLRGQDWVPMVELVNAHIDGNNAWEQINRLRNDGLLEFHPDGIDGKPQVRVVDADVPGDADVPNLPDGAENDFEAFVLRVLDGADGAGLRRSEMVDLDSPDATEQLAAIEALVDRGILEETRDGLNGPPTYRRVQAPDQTPPEAENEVEANILERLDALDRPALRSDLLDPDAPDFEERMEAIRALVDRGILRQATNRETGKLEFRRPSSSGSSATPMSDDDAINALRSGADPMLIANGSLNRALSKAGFERILNGDAGISANNYWVMGAHQGEFPINVPGGSDREGRKVYMVKKSAAYDGYGDFMPNDVMNEVIAGAISSDLLEKLGRDGDNAPLFHPRVGIAEAPKGVGPEAHGAVIMDHAAYGFPEGYEFNNGSVYYGGFDNNDLREGGAGPDMLRLAMFDYLTNNAHDRHGKNQFYARDPETGQIRVVVIDNGFGFGAAEAQGADRNMSFRQYTRFKGDTGQQRPRDLIKRVDRSDRDMVRTTVQSFVDTYGNFDVESAMDRIRAVYPGITPDQEAYAREWLEVTNNRIQAMSSDIEGVVDAIVTA